MQRTVMTSIRKVTEFNKAQASSFSKMMKCSFLKRDYEERRIAEVMEN